MKRKGIHFWFCIALGGLVAGLGFALSAPAVTTNSFVNFETAPVHPVDLSADGSRLAVCNLPDGQLELFDVSSGFPVSLGSVPVGIDPVSVRFRTTNEVWVVNHISDSISIVDLDRRRVIRTLQTLDTPADVVFAGSPLRAFVSCSMPNTVQVFDPLSRQATTNLLLAAERPKALAVSPDGQRVYVAIFESGNGTTLVGGTLFALNFVSNAVNLASGPYHGQNPPPNSGTNFSPPINVAITNLVPPKTGMIVRKQADGRWMDDNHGDWSRFVSGTDAPLTQRIPGWDLPDRDMALIDTRDLTIHYATGLMNLCMNLAVNPASGQIAVIGTDAINEVRFEPNLNGVFVRTKIALVDAVTLASSVKDLNPHLDYTVRTLPQAQRDKSLGDPRGIAWNSNGTRCYVTGMGSHNLVVLDAAGDRVSSQAVELESGASGLALDEIHHRLYVLNRFAASLSVVDITSDTVVGTVHFFDPTPPVIRAGRKHLYDTRNTSGLGQAACASCHPDARMDRLAWDLGDPAGTALQTTRNRFGIIAPVTYHPMKGVMVTQTLQDIIGHEPFHWRGDHPDLESFNSTFTNLQAAPVALSTDELKEFTEFLATIQFPPNPYRTFQNGLSTNVALPGHVATGRRGLPAGSPLPPGNAVTGASRFVANCARCHTLPTGLGFDFTLNNVPIPTGIHNEHHIALFERLEGQLLSKMPQFRNLPDRVGMDGSRAGSRAGFGFSHDGSTDTLTHFLEGESALLPTDQVVADQISFLLSVSGSDLPDGQTNSAIGFLPGLPSKDVPAAVGKQLTIDTPQRIPLLEAMITLANSATSRVELIAKGVKENLQRGWCYNPDTGNFQSDRRSETATPDELVALASIGSELTFTIVPRHTGQRLGIDRDDDGIFDRDELDAGTNPNDRGTIELSGLPGSIVVIVNSNCFLSVIADADIWDFRYQWFKDGEALSGATNAGLLLTNMPLTATGDYSVLVLNPIHTATSSPVRITVVPFLAAVTPSNQSVPLGSNATFTVSTIGEGPFTYQWRRDDMELPGATDPTLLLTNAQWVNEGPYSVAVANTYGASVTEPATLVVLVKPAFIVPPSDQEVVAGGNATFSFEIAGNPPPFGYQLRLNGATLTNYSTDHLAGFLTLFNVQSNQAGLYRIVVTNAANFPPGLGSGLVRLTVQTDSDGDGLPDVWENAHGLDINNPADAALDADLDGATNLDEFLAGTDPLDPHSYLRIESVEVAGTGRDRVVLRFGAISNHTYSVVFRDTVGAANWSRFADVLSLPTNRIVMLTNVMPAGVTQRIYRLATPRTP